MPARISYGQSTFTAEAGENVLDCLSRNGIAVPHACRSGVCHSCLMHAEEGPIPELAQNGLKTTYKKQNLFLACQCSPEADMRVSLPETDRLDVRGVISAKEMLNRSVLRVKITPQAPFACEPGQYLTLINASGVARSYSIANDPAAEGHIELHVRLLDNGLMSGFLQAAPVGEQIVLRGPAGNCFYVPEDGLDHPIVLAGTGTGLAPLYGILRKALESGHRAPIRLFHGALVEEDLYLVGQIEALQRTYGNFRYTACVLNGGSGSFFAVGNIEGIVLAGLPPQKLAARLFLCGAPEFVAGVRRKAFLAGVASKHIFADAFLPAKPVPVAA
jgi:CDP-4-dehydro-6-deoxyglucose reductase, E3